MFWEKSEVKKKVINEIIRVNEKCDVEPTSDKWAATHVVLVRVVWITQWF